LVDAAPVALREAVAISFHKLLAVKDEYEVARLHLASISKAQETFDGTLRPSFHLAPPFWPSRDAQGRPKKRAFGPWIIPVFRLLHQLTPLRGTKLDPFGYSAERRMERDMIGQYEADITEISANYSAAKHSIAAELAALPQTVRGFGPVKQANAEKAALRRQALWAEWRRL
jgi:indolepyruvate ferredoxin oxidoreductase